MIETQGSFEDLQNSNILYAKLLNEEQEQPDEDKQKIIDAAKVSRQMSTRVRLTCKIHYKNLIKMGFNLLE